MLKERKKLFLLGLGLAILCVLFIQMFNPLRKSQKKIEKSLLKLTPIGSDMENVLREIEDNKKWKLRNKSDDFGYLHPDPSTSTVDKYNSETGYYHVGEKSIEVYMGEYSIPLRTVSVVALYGFDKNNKLIDVYIWKDVDGP